MDAAGRRVDLLLQRVGVGRLELRKLAPLQYLARDRHAVAFEPFELALVGRPVARLALASAFQAHLVEQYFAELLGAADRKGLSGESVNLALHAQHVVRELARQAREIVAVDHDAGAFHALDDGGQWPIDHFIDARAALDRQAELEQLPQPPRDLGILSRILRCAVERHFGEADLRLTGPAHVLERQADVIEMQLRQFVEPVLMLARVEREAHHQRVVIGRDGDAVLGEHADVIFQVMADLQHRFIGKKRMQPADRIGERYLLGAFGEHVGSAMAERDVAGAPGTGRQADPDEIARHAVERRGFGIDRNDMRGARCLDPAV